MGKKVIVRTKDAGVFYGEIAEMVGDFVHMINVRNIWYWSGAASLNQLAMEGVKHPDDSKFTVYANSIKLLGVIEILECTDEAIKSIEGVKPWRIG